MLEGVKHIILILSGKGGVGKSTVSSLLALTLKDCGFKVGLLDIDLCGPSVPHLLHLEDKDVHQCPQGWVPVYADKEKRLAVMSIGFLLKSSKDSVVWRGPKKTAMIKQFLTDVFWEELDYLIIDTPPGTSDEHITVMENLRNVNCDGAILVTTPQAVSIEDVAKELTFCRKTGIPVLGIIENMSGYVCVNCAECTNIFSSGGGQLLADKENIPFLGCIPIDPRVAKCGDNGENFLSAVTDSPVTLSFKTIVKSLTQSDNC